MTHRNSSYQLIAFIFLCVVCRRPKKKQEDDDDDEKKNTRRTTKAEKPPATGLVCAWTKPRSTVMLCKATDYAGRWENRRAANAYAKDDIKQFTFDLSGK